jgi:DNA polymerase-3 subunit delta'
MIENMRSTQVMNDLAELSSKGKLSHAYILQCNDKGHLKSFAFELSKKITRFSEDIHYICAEGLSLKDGSIESLLQRLDMKPLVGKINIAIIDDADIMTVRAQNRLLKTLEEPKGRSLILLLCSNSENLLATIRSRCVFIRLDCGAGDSETSADDIDKYAKMIGAAILNGQGYYTIMDELKEIVKERDVAYRFLDELEGWCRDAIVWELGVPLNEDRCFEGILKGYNIEEKAYEIITLIEEARRDLDRRLNTGYAVKNMIFKVI